MIAVRRHPLAMTLLSQIFFSNKKCNISQPADVPDTQALRPPPGLKSFDDGRVKRHDHSTVMCSGTINFTAMIIFGIEK
jgi:hypothetical protein